MPTGAQGGGGALLIKKKTGLFGGNAVLWDVECALMCFHGMNGEDGTVQGLLELYGVPYTSAACSVPPPVWTRSP